MPTLSINPSGLARLRSTKPELDNDLTLAQRIKVDRSTLTRVLNGKAEPGPKFIAGVLQAFGYRWFGEIFQVVDD